MDTRVSTRDLLHGMYVSKLDRPWLETPFLLQGFRILSDPDVELLQQYCEFVYVDEERSERTLRTADRRKTPDRRRQYSSVLPDNPVTYADTAEVRRELVEARKIHNEISGIVTEFMDDVRAGNSVDVDAVKESVGCMLESIPRNPDAFMWLRRLKNKDS